MATGILPLRNVSAALDCIRGRGLGACAGWFSGFIALRRAAAGGVAFDYFLPGARHPQRSVGDVLGDGGAGAYTGAVADRHGRHEHGVAADFDVVADDGRMLVPAV